MPRPAPTPAPITRHAPRGRAPLVPSHDPSEEAAASELSNAAETVLEAQPNNTEGGKPRAYTAHAGIRIHCAYDEIADIDSLVPHPRNPNVHPAPQIEMLAKIIMGTGRTEADAEVGGDDSNRADGGYREALTLSRRSGFIIKGHGRRGAAFLIKQLTGETAVPIVWQDYASEAEEYADMVADNRIAELSTLDAKAVADLMSETSMAFPDFDLSMFAYGTDEIAAFSGGWAPQNDPTRSGQSSAESRESIKVMCEKADKELVLNRLKTALIGITNATVE